jgi:8-oxo-dGTP diphosphatase
MNVIQYREVAGALLVDTLGRFLLQQRDDKPGIVSPGKVGLFGGHREGAESFLECVVREVHEEISYLVPAEAFEHIAVRLDRTTVAVRSRARRLHIPLRNTGRKPYLG